MKIKVAYDDGTVEVYKVKPRHLVDFEDEYGGFAESAKSAFQLAHIASDSGLPFREWLDTVDDIEQSGDEGDAQGSPAGEGGEPVPTG